MKRSTYQGTFRSQTALMGLVLVSAALTAESLLTAPALAVSSPPPGGRETVLTVDPVQVAAWNTAQAVVAHVVDGTGAPVAGATVTFAAYSGTSDEQQGTTDANGTVTFSHLALSNASAALTASRAQTTGSYTALDLHVVAGTVLSLPASAPTYHTVAPMLQGLPVDADGAALDPVQLQVSQDQMTWTNAAGIGKSLRPFIWSAQARSYFVRAVDPGGALDPSTTNVAQITFNATPPPAWLSEFNTFRQQAGVAAIPEDDALSAEARLHAHYAALNKFIGHTEDPSKAGYSAGGVDSASHSNETAGAGPGHLVDGWINAPYHSSCLFDDRLRAAGYGNEHGYAGLDCGHDSEYNAPPPARAYVWPTPGSLLRADLASGGGEFPNPLAACHATAPWGTAAIFGLRGAVSDPEVRVPLDAGRVTVEGRPVPSCTNDLSGYDREAVAVLPLQPLPTGAHVVVTLTVGGRMLTNYFQVAGTLPPIQRRLIVRLGVLPRHAQIRGVGSVRVVSAQAIGGGRYRLLLIVPYGSYGNRSLSILVPGHKALLRRNVVKLS